MWTLVQSLKRTISMSKFTSAHVIFAIAAHNSWETDIIDIISTYLYGKLHPDKRIFMKPPPGIILPGIKPNQFLHLQSLLVLTTPQHLGEYGAHSM